MANHTTKINAAKLEAVKALKENFSKYRDYVFTDYRGLTVAQITNLRGQLRKYNAAYKVIKNNYARVAFQELNYPDVAAYLEGPTAVALAVDDVNQVVKSILDFSKESTVKVKGGLIDRNVFDFKQVEAFSKLPTKKELYARLMGSMQAPLQNMVYVMNGVTTKLVRTLKAVADKKSA